ncbi:hypothetical protein [Planotetraspora kaengkrachanensis]|uniref:Fibronectin type-III domain-containing protein n=1 Tax=Planotetraspora kaengkrachanensis TaxID=575193 RepID=A0A8J3PUU8_9ACTN|nr:hypothetical protein [Planotetraspora kaengkrachanensis]GIG81442.1 hypothetical protein Pka01_45690 [Planotetraspora kaengkrachanensis]
MISGLGPGMTYDFQVGAVATSGNAGAWSAITSAVANPDTIAPSAPAPPTVAASRIAFQITHTLGQAAGGTYNLEKDLDHLEVHVGPATGFTPDASTLRGTVSANAGMMQAAIPAIGTVTVDETTVIAVDAEGNKSSPSPAASATALLIDDLHISDVTVSKLTAGTLAGDITLSARIKTANTGARVELNAGGLQAYNAANSQTVNISAADGSVSLTGTISSGVTGRRVILNPPGSVDPEIRFYPASGTAFARIYGAPSTTIEPEIRLQGTVGANGSTPSLFLGSGFSDWLLDNAGATPDCRIRLQANGDVGVTAGAFRSITSGVGLLQSTGGDVTVQA